MEDESISPTWGAQKRGVFATRSPHRPNPIGLSLVDLIEVRGLTLHVRNIDLLDGTPILDIKPYLPYVEAHPDAYSGWIEEAAKAGEYSVTYSDLASSQVEFLKQYGVDLRPRIERVLSRDPKPHPYKRIEEQDGKLVQAIRGWRIVFRVEEKVVTVMKIHSGYSDEAIVNESELSDRSAQIAFQGAFGSGT